MPAKAQVQAAARRFAQTAGDPERGKVDTTPGPAWPSSPGHPPSRAFAMRIMDGSGWTDR